MTNRRFRSLFVSPPLSPPNRESVTAPELEICLRIFPAASRLDGERCLPDSRFADQIRQ